MKYPKMEFDPWRGLIMAPSNLEDEIQQAVRHQKIYHITHIDNLKSIFKHGFIWCDADISKICKPKVIGNTTIKGKRLFATPLRTHPTIPIGKFVPFNFCYRSVMLYAVVCPQEDVAHIVGDLHKVVKYANEDRTPWAFTTGNAVSSRFDDYDDLEELGQIDWEAVNATYWGDESMKSGKQAEFLFGDNFPVSQIERIVVRSQEAWARVVNALSGLKHPPVDVSPGWYYQK